MADQNQTFFDVVDENELRALAEALRDVLAVVSERPLAPGLRFPRPAPHEIDGAVTAALQETARLVERTFQRRLTRRQANRLRRETREALERAATTPDVHFDAVLHNLRNVDYSVDISRNTLVLFSGGRIGGIVFNTQDDRELAQVILVVSVVVEIIGLIAGLIGLSLPAVNPRALAGVFRRFSTDQRFRDALAALIRALRNASASATDKALAIIQFLQVIRSIGALSELLDAWLRDLDWWEYAKILAKLIAWIVLLVGSGGAGAAVKIANVLFNIGELLTKFEKLDKM